MKYGGLKMVSGIWSKLIKRRRQKKYRTPVARKRLVNILSFAGDLIDSAESNQEKNDSIFILIKMLTDKILLDNTMEVIETFETIDYLGPTELFSFENLLIRNISQQDSIAIRNKIKKIETIQSVDVNLATDPVLATVWSRQKLPDLWTGLGITENEWKDTGSHFYNLYLPIGVTFSHTDGNHSTTIGVLKRIGKVTLGADTHNKLYDISELYNIIEFDGINYRYIQSKKIIGRAVSFEFGCIFEIGRLLLKNKISFTAGK